MLSKLSGKPANTVIDPNYLLGYSFVTEHNDTQQRATIVDLGMDKVTLQFLNRSKALVEYNDLINIINEQDEDSNGLQSFKQILDHRKTNRNWEVKVAWDDGDVTWEPLHEMRLFDMITLAKYAHDNDLINTP